MTKKTSKKNGHTLCVRGKNHERPRKHGICVSHTDSKVRTLASKLTPMMWYAIAWAKIVPSLRRFAVGIPARATDRTTLNALVRHGVLSEATGCWQLTELGQAVDRFRAQGGGI